MAIVVSDIVAHTGWTYETTPDIQRYSPYSGTGQTTGSWTPPTTGLLICAVSWYNQGGNQDPTISGNNLTWVAMCTPGGWNGRQIGFWGADASGATTGTTTLAWGAALYRFNANFFQVTGTDYLNGIAQTGAQYKLNGTATPSTSYSITFDSGEQYSGDRVIAMFLSEGGGDTRSPTNSFTAAGNPYPNAMSMYRTDAYSQTGGMSWTGSYARYGAMLELKIAQDKSLVLPNQRTMQHLRAR